MNEMPIEGTNSFFKDFFSSYSNELKSRMKRLDTLIGHDHWLSVGNYKESILRQLVANVIPKNMRLALALYLHQTS